MKFYDILTFVSAYGYDGVSTTNITYNNCEVYKPLSANSSCTNNDVTDWVLVQGENLSIVSGDDGKAIRKLISGQVLEV